MRILIVEDNVAVAGILITACVEAGHEIAGHARSVEQGLRLASEAQCDVAVLDVDLMGQSSGPVALELVRRKVPFLVLSGAPEFRGKGHHGAPLMLKPFKIDNLLKAISSLQKLCPERVSA